MKNFKDYINEVATMKTATQFDESIVLNENKKYKDQMKKIKAIIKNNKVGPLKTNERDVVNPGFNMTGMTIYNFFNIEDDVYQKIVADINKSEFTIKKASKKATDMGSMTLAQIELELEKPEMDQKIVWKVQDFVEENINTLKTLRGQLTSNKTDQKYINSLLERTIKSCEKMRGPLGKLIK